MTTMITQETTAAEKRKKKPLFTTYTQWHAADFNQTLQGPPKANMTRNAAGCVDHTLRLYQQNDSCVVMD